MSSLDALAIPGSVPDETPPGDDLTGDTPPPTDPEPVKPEDQTPPVKPVTKAPEKTAPTKTPDKTAKPADKAPPAKPGTFREIHEQTKAKLTQAEAKIKELEAKVSKPVDDPRVKDLTSKYEAAQKRAEAAETELKYVNYEKHPEFGDKYVKPMEEAYANGVESAKGFRVTDDTGERHGTEKDFDEFMAIADPEAAWKFAEGRFGSKASVMWQHRQSFVKALNAKSKAVEDFRKTGVEREKQTVAQRDEQQRQLSEQWGSLLKEGVEKYPDYFKEADGDDAGNKVLNQGMAIADLAFGVLPPDMVDRLPVKIQKALVDGKLPPGELVKLHAAVRNMAGGFNRVVQRLVTKDAKIKELEAKIAGYEQSEPTGRGDGGGKPVNGKKQQSWEEQLDALGR